MTLRSAAAALALSTAGLAALAAPSLAATAVPYSGVGKHTTVLNNIYRAQQRNNAAISHVQNNIRATRPKTY